MLSLTRVHQQRDTIYKIAEKFHAADLRVFGSVARGKNDANSEEDLVPLRGTLHEIIKDLKGG